jgi:chromosome segregation ATPase
MVEMIMYFGIGFLCASLFGIVLIPLIHNRAVRLTMRRMEAATPLSMAEIQADKDQLRAEFAMSMRRLEVTVEQLKAKSTNQLGELGRKSDAIRRLKAELDEKIATISDLEAREQALKGQLEGTEDQHGVATTTLRETELALADTKAALARVTAELGERTAVCDGQNVEILALNTQVDALKLQLEDLEKDLRDSQDRLQRARGGADITTAELVAERSKAQNLANRVAELERELAAQTAEAEILSRRVQDVEARFNEHGRMLIERTEEATRLRGELAASEERHRETAETLRTYKIRLEAEFAEIQDEGAKLQQNIASLKCELAARDAEVDRLGGELASSEERHRETTAAAGAEKARLETELAQLHAERAKLHDDIVATKRELESAGAAERRENALLREHIDEIAAEVVRLTMTLEGPSSPIAAILDSPQLAGNGGAARQNGEQSPADLADRIRALQSKARAPTAS